MSRPGPAAAAAAFLLSCVGAGLGIATLDSWLLGLILAIGCASTVPALSVMPSRRAPRPAGPPARDPWTVPRLLRGAATMGASIVAAALVGVAIGLRDGDLAIFVVAVAMGVAAAAIGPLGG